MKVFNEIGSKERFSEIFQKVNKVKLNESFGQTLNPQAVLEDSFNQLKNGNLTIKHSSTQANENESYVELICVDKEQNNITFTFKAIVDESDQEGVFNVTEVGLEGFSFDSVTDDESVELSGDSLKRFNIQHRNELFDIVDKYLDVKEEEPAEMDEIYEDAVKRIDAVPYKGGSERMQKHKAYADEKPTNSAVRVSAEELEKFIKEEFGELPPEYVNPEDIEKGFEVNKYIDTEDEPLVDPDTIQPEEQEVPEDVKRIILQAYDNLVQKAQQERKYNYSPTQLEVEDEILRITGQKVVKEKKRVFPKEAEPFLENGSVKPQALNIPQALDKQFSPETKEMYVNMAKDLIDKELGDNVHLIPKNTYLKLIKQYANQLMQQSLVPSGIGLNESEKSDYPTELGKEFKPETDYPKAKKKYKSKKVKIKEEENQEDDAMPLEPADADTFAQEKEETTGKKGYHVNIEQETINNENFRKVLYTGEHLQLVLMTLQPEEEIGVETHDTIDQFFRFEAGTGKAVINGNEYEVVDGDSIIIPSGSEHNIINTGTEPLKIYTIYAPPNHQDGVEFKTKGDAEASDEKFDGKTTEGEPDEEKPEGEKAEEISEATDAQMTDVLLGYEPKNVGDDMGEEYDYAAAEVGYENQDAYQKYLEYQEKDFNSLTDDEKEELFGLWQQFRGAEKVNEAPNKFVVVFDGTSAYVDDEINVPKSEEIVATYDNIDDAQAHADELNAQAGNITEQQLKMAKQALNNRGLTEGISKRDAVLLLIKNNIKY